VGIPVPARTFLSRVSVACNPKHSSLLKYNNTYVRKNVCDTGPCPKIVATDKEPVFCVEISI
jgi:hypothetical protein